MRKRMIKGFMTVATLLALAVMLFGASGCAVVSGRAGESRYTGWAFGEKAASTLAGLNVTEDQKVVEGIIINDRGVGVETAGSQSETQVTQMLGNLLLAGLSAYTGGAFKPNTNTPDVDDGIEHDRITFAQSTTESGSIATAPLTGERGYDAVPDADGHGVYGRPSCSRCAAYVANGGSIINIDNAAYRAAMWATLKGKGFTGSSIQLPVSITAGGYTGNFK